MSRVVLHVEAPKNNYDIPITTVKLDIIQHLVSLAPPFPRAPSRPIQHQRQDSVAIGRSPDNNQVVLDDVEVSRWHARLDVSGSNVMLTDLNSANGTFLNGKPVASSSFGSCLFPSIRLPRHQDP